MDASVGGQAFGVVQPTANDRGGMASMGSPATVATALAYSPHFRPNDISMAFGRKTNDTQSGSGASGAYELPHEASEYLATKHGPKNDTILIAFPGTRNAKDALVDLQFPVKELEDPWIPPCDPNSKRTSGAELKSADKICVHRGFYRRWLAVCTLDGKFMSDLSNWMGEKRRRIIFTGHSLGGAVASLAAMWLMQNRVPGWKGTILCITFGSPFVGNAVLANIMREKGWDRHFLHVVSRHDIVPRLLISHCETYKVLRTLIPEALGKYITFLDSLVIDSYDREGKAIKEQAALLCANTSIQSPLSMLKAAAGSVDMPCGLMDTMMAKLYDSIATTAPKLKEQVRDSLKDRKCRFFGVLIVHTEAGPLQPVADPGLAVELLALTMEMAGNLGSTTESTRMFSDHRVIQYQEVAGGAKKFVLGSTTGLVSLSDLVQDMNISAPDKCIHSLKEKFDDLERRIRSTTQLMDSSTRRARRTMSTLSNAAADVVQAAGNVTTTAAAAARSVASTAATAAADITSTAAAAASDVMNAVAGTASGSARSAATSANNVASPAAGADTPEQATGSANAAAVDEIMKAAAVAVHLMSEAAEAAAEVMTTAAITAANGVTPRPVADGADPRVIVAEARAAAVASAEVMRSAVAAAGDVMTGAAEAAAARLRKAAEGAPSGGQPALVAVNPSSAAVPDDRAASTAAASAHEATSTAAVPTCEIPTADARAAGGVGTDPAPAAAATVFARKKRYGVRGTYSVQVSAAAVIDNALAVQA